MTLGFGLGISAGLILVAIWLLCLGFRAWARHEALEGAVHRKTLDQVMRGSDPLWPRKGGHRG